MRTINSKTTRWLLPASMAVACFLTAVTTVNAIADLARPEPRIGDIIAFTPSTAVSPLAVTRLIVHRQDQFGCVLDLSTLLHSGGSLVVESQTAGDTAAYHVHWAGSRTSADPGNCGSDADLIVDHRDLDILAFSAGGFGVPPRRMPVFGYDVVN